MRATVHQLYSSRVYEPELLWLLGEAFDLACHVLPLHCNRQDVARGILRAADSGERHVPNLIEAGISSAAPLRRQA